MTSHFTAAQPIPLFEEVPFCEPDTLLLALSDQPHLAFLDSAQQSRNLGRYSYLAFSPFAIFSAADGKAYWNDTQLAGSTFVALKAKLEQFRQVSLPDPLPPFQGGAVGYFAYEAGRCLERLPRTSQEDLRLKDIVLPFFDVILAVDHFADAATSHNQARAWIISTGWPETGDGRTARAKERLTWFKERLHEAATNPSKHISPPAISGWRSNVSRPQFEDAIETTRDYILNGDIFQANIAQHLSASWPRSDNATPLAYYAQMRTINAAPFSAYLDCGDHFIASSSPERFLTLDQEGHVHSRPIKGTAPRDLTDATKDKALADALMASAKDRAENVMITDLLRNDLSKVCNPRSIKVPDLCKLESYARVHHLVSTVTGEMKDNHGAVALLGASFPGGSITGAPKIRAMEIITEIENIPRGIYCGAIGFLGFDGAMDTNIAIRTVTFKDDEVRFSVGGGITILSDPAAEYEETLHKANAIFRSFGTSVEAEYEALSGMQNAPNEEPEST